MWGFFFFKPSYKYDNYENADSWTPCGVLFAGKSGQFAQMNVVEEEEQKQEEMAAKEEEEKREKG